MNIKIKYIALATLTLTGISCQSSAWLDHYFAHWLIPLDPNAQLLQATENDDFEQLVHAIKNGADIDTIDREGYTALLKAVVTNNTSIAIHLLTTRANPNIIDRDGNTALRLAIYHDNETIIDQLLQSGAPIAQTDEHGHTLLMSAASLGQVKAVQILLAHGASPHAISTYGETALSTIIRAIVKEQNRQTIIDQLLQANADINQANENGHTALMAAADSGCAEAIRILIAHGANLDSCDTYDTALDLASKPRTDTTDAKKYREIQNQLKHAQTDKTAMLARAINNNDLKGVQFLIESGASTAGLPNTLKRKLGVMLPQKRRR